MIRFIFDAIVLGLTLAIVFGVGPAFITLIQTSIHRGFRSAAWFAFGVCLNDLLIMSLCVLTSIQVVANNDRELFFFSLGAGVILILFGVFTYTRKVKEDNFKGIKERTDEIIDENKEIFKNEDGTTTKICFDPNDGQRTLIVVNVDSEGKKIDEKILSNPLFDNAPLVKPASTNEDGKTCEEKLNELIGENKENELSKNHQIENHANKSKSLKISAVAPQNIKHGVAPKQTSCDTPKLQKVQNMAK